MELILALVAHALLMQATHAQAPAPPATNPQTPVTTTLPPAVTGFTVMVLTLVLVEPAQTTPAIHVLHHVLPAMKALTLAPTTQLLATIACSVTG